MIFWKEDESWMCNKNKCAPSLRVSRPRHETKTPRTKQLIELTSDLASPGTDEFSRRLADNHVVLESAIMRAPLAFLTVRVANKSFEKRVTIRTTTDNWATFKDVEGHFLPGGATSVGTDRFYATLSVPNYSKQAMQFAVRYTCAGAETWDNNNGNNYTIAVSAAVEIREDGARGWGVPMSSS